MFDTQWNYLPVLHAVRMLNWTFVEDFWESIVSVIDIDDSVIQFYP